MTLGNSMREIAVIIVILIVSFLCAVAAGGPEEFPITVNPSAQHFPRVYGNIVVWEDHKNGNGDIYGYDLSRQEEFPITTHPYNQENPAIYGDIVVWEERRDGEYALCGCNLLTKELFEITTSSRGICNPAIYEDIVVWEDHGIGSPGILGYNLSTEEEFQVTPDPDEQRNPAIYKDIIVWEDERNHKDMIYCYDLSEGQEFQLSTSRRVFLPRYSQHDPAIYGDVVIWTEGLDNIIYVYSLSSSEEFTIATAQSEKCPGTGRYVGSERPAIHKDVIVWVDCRNGSFDIYGYNLSTEEEFAVTESAGRQQSPAVYEDIVVWEDKRNGNWDIYGCYLSPPLPTTLLNYQERRLLLKVSGGLLMVIPLAVAGILVKHNKKIITYLDEAPKEMLFPEMSPRTFMRIGTRSLFDVIPVFVYGGCTWIVIMCLLNKSYFLGVFSFGFGALFIIEMWWNRNIPYIHTTTDEIAVFPSAPRRPKIVKWDAIERINQQEGKNTIRLYLPDDKHIEIDLSFLKKNDTEELFKILKQLSCPWTVSFHHSPQ